jgi:hypothetical protein
MMSSASKHHEEADRLLDQAHAEQDTVRRGRILAEAQVHATLALAAATGAGYGSQAARSSQTDTAAARGLVAEPSPGTVPSVVFDPMPPPR